MRKNVIALTDFSDFSFSSFVCYFELSLAIISKKTKNIREPLRNSLKGNEQFQIPNSSFLRNLGEKPTGFALLRKYFTWFWVTIFKQQLKTTTSQSKLVSSPHCTIYIFFSEINKKIIPSHFIDTSL